MNAPDILTRLRDLGVQVTVNGEKLRLEPASVIPPDFVQVVRERKADILDLLRKRQLDSRYVIPNGPTSLDEALEIERRVDESGICLTWSTVVKDFIAFIKSHADRTIVPPGFIVYTLSELRALCPREAPGLDTDALLLIHHAKKIGGGQIVSSEAEETTP